MRDPDRRRKMMTDAELSRAMFVSELRRLIDPNWMQAQYRDMPLPASDHFWFHFTDLPLDGGIQFWDRLLTEALIAPVPEIRYQARGDYMDHFPPNCWRLTAKGRHVLDNPHEYVYAVGETS